MRPAAFEKHGSPERLLVFHFLNSCTPAAQDVGNLCVLFVSYCFYRVAYSSY